jgi:thiol:disulfide interchange protein DsbD
VVLSFWALAGTLLARRAAGNQFGWGFQMQSPGFVAALAILFFLIALNLFGVFEIGGSLVGLDAKASARAGGSVSSFLNGALATVAATPCTAPFMGSALGFAAQQPAVISMLVFTFLALGMAAPYLLLTIFPQTLRFVPKPGAWMEALKQFMGFLLMATVAWLLPVYGALTNRDWLGWLLLALVFIGICAWIFGRWGVVHTVLFAPLAALALYALRPMPDTWAVWTPDAVHAALAKGKPVFVDFTADWCLSCKVNEKLALDTDGVKKAFTDKNVTLFRADWTQADPQISATLQQYNRDGVPLYLLYSPKAPDAPQVLPAVLTPGIVLDALNKI